MLQKGSEGFAGRRFLMGGWRSPQAVVSLHLFSLRPIGPSRCFSSRIARKTAAFSTPPSPPAQSQHPLCNSHRAAEAGVCDGFPAQPPCLRRSLLASTSSPSSSTASTSTRLPRSTPTASPSRNPFDLYRAHFGRPRGRSRQCRRKDRLPVPAMDQRPRQGRHRHGDAGPANEGEEAGRAGQGDS